MCVGTYTVIGCGIQKRLFGVIVKCIPIALTVIEVSLAVDLVGAALGHRGDNSTGSAAVFGGVNPGVDGELADGAGRGGVGFAGTPALFRIKIIVIIGTVDLNIVENRADAANAHESETAGVRNDARRGEGQSRPAAVIDGNIQHSCWVESLGEVRRFQVHDRGLFGDDDFGAGRGDGETRLKGGDLSDKDDDIVSTIVGEVRGSNGDGVFARLEQWRLEVTAAVGDEIGGESGGDVLDMNGGAGDSGIGRVQDGTRD